MSLSKLWELVMDEWMMDDRWMMMDGWMIYGWLNE